MNSPLETWFKRLPVPASVREDWPAASFGIEAGRGIVVRALGLSLSSVFQAIHAPDGRVVGEEALLRASVRHKPLPPLTAFEYAESQRKLVAFDRLCRTLHLLNDAGHADRAQTLYLNVHPKMLTEVSDRHGAVFQDILESLDSKPSRIVLEIGEDEIAESDINRARAALQSYRSRGYRIAIDDFGRRHANLDRLWQLEPDVIKIDRSLIGEAESSPRLRRALPKLVELLHELGGEVIVEGVETETQRQIAIDAGADALQGFLLDEPRWRG
ncbi:EAL domain-containing protein [Jeongeupia naejangsanensis]|uniref:EAL domain-containing protein n=1 Tax=Jeongeupia naejangsanensis TaxID=613195 RepID=A0ABS2BQ05_9NEIS|nr:EAL domain-containing protein [Jeongeupia naejangsanensis]MBM3117515.1 EAL domain-containing protein [Jeongeupia naejangsanensis]